MGMFYKIYFYKEWEISAFVKVFNEEAYKTYFKGWVKAIKGDDCFFVTLGMYKKYSSFDERDCGKYDDLNNLLNGIQEAIKKAERYIDSIESYAEMLINYDFRKLEGV